MAKSVYSCNWSVIMNACSARIYTSVTSCVTTSSLLLLGVSAFADVIRVGTIASDVVQQNVDPAWTTRSVPHTVPDGTDLLLVTAAVRAVEDTLSATWNGTTMTLIDQTTPDTSSSSITTYTWGLVSPDDGTFYVAITVSAGTVSNSTITATNYVGSITSSVGAATNFVGEYVSNNISSDTLSIDSGGSSGNFLYVAGAFRGPDQDPITVSTGWTDVLETTLPSGVNDKILQLAEKTAPSGITMTSPVADRMAGHMIEIQQVLGTGWAAMNPSAETVRDFATFANFSPLLATNPTYEFIYITNLNTSGAGSFDSCVSGAGSADVLRFCIPTVSGLVTYPNGSQKSVSRSNLVVAMQYAPSPGFHIRGLGLNIRGSNQLWMHYSCFTGQAAPSNAGRCITITGTQTDDGIHDIILLNIGGVFSSDGPLNVYKDAVRVDVIQAMFPYPVPSVTDPDFRQGVGLLSDYNGSVTDISYLRGVCTHFTHRCPKLTTADALIANNVALHGQSSYTDITRVLQTGIDFNVVGNLYIAGETQDATPPSPPIRLGAPVQNTTAIYDVFVSGNRGNDIDDTPETDLIDDLDGNFSNTVGSILADAMPQGFVATAIGTTDQDEEDFAALVCGHAGPRPNDRLAIYQQACDEIETEFADGNSGNLIDSAAQHNLGFPTVEQNSCDPEITNHCGPGIPALPVDNPNGQASFIDATWTAIMDAHCARMPAGATGC